MKPELITPAVIINKRTLREVHLNDLEGNNNDEGSLKYYEQQCKKAVNYTLGNSHKYIRSTYGHLFSFTVYFSAQINPKKNFHWEIHLWDATGTNTVCSYNIPSERKETDMMPEDIYNSIIKDCDDFTHGIQICSGCGKKVKKEEIGGSYFAGQYCGHCWETKWKAIEKAETYD